MNFDAPTTISGLLVGIVVGLTGVGGGALMTPILVLFFGIAPQTAVGTDLLVAAVTKMFGTAVHHRHGSVDWQVVRRLALGSLPAAALTLVWMQWSGSQRVSDGLIINAVAVALMATAAGMLLKPWLHQAGRRQRIGQPEVFKKLQRWLTSVAGAVLGVLVTLTSIGAGALGTVMMVHLYPLRLTPHKLVGTDLAHAIPLALIAGLGHLFIGNVDGTLLVNLLLGSIPGVLLGSMVASKVPTRWVQGSISVVLVTVGVKMLLH
ncbi:sulfite exporter TauE/SafE family protein [Azohydromonas australica]|uniref:sulfite exporter TauE/SafE family protein n=1 Tax=Azohydromonas australica TaxID=364039 RepID=UPI000421653B|nr:sulfite exporter TauE/SafE family protein [Azohydromonas australica]